MRARSIVAVDLFCGVGGLTSGLRAAGIKVIAGIDVDPRCRYPYEYNNGSKFLLRDVTTLSGAELAALFGRSRRRLLAGCAPCQPFSSHLKGRDRSQDPKWSLLETFGRLVGEVLPEFVTMENVPRIRSASVFRQFIAGLEENGYTVVWKSLYCPNFGVPQERRRLVLLASRIGSIELPKARRGKLASVRTAIGGLPEIENGDACVRDPLHLSRKLSTDNLQRIIHSKPGGTWHDWPANLRLPCHSKPSGSTYSNVYGRMEWDRPAPTITTQFHNYGTGRFGHPAQNRALSLREGALLQSFPRHYRFVPPGEPVMQDAVGRLIGNAVPPLLAKAIGDTFIQAKDATK